MRLRLAAAVVASCALAAAAGAADTPAPGTIVTVAVLEHPRGLALLPDGSVLVPEPFAGDVRKVAPDGTVTTVAGDGVLGFDGDGGPATAAELDQPHGVALLPDGAFLIADALNNRIRRVGPDGLITTVVGTGRDAFSGDGGPAVDAAIGAPRGIATLADGTLLIADSDNNRIRRVSPDGTIDTIAGDGSAGFAGDGGSADAAELKKPFGVAPVPGGGYLIADTANSRIRLVGPDGTIGTVAGNGVAGFAGDGGSATEAELNHPHAVLALPRGGFLIADTENDRVRRVWPDGTITTIAGTGLPGFSGDGGPAAEAQLDEPKALAPLPSGAILVADSSNNRLRVIAEVRPSPPRIAAVVVLGGAVIDLRFRVCDASRAGLVAEVRLTVDGSIQPPAATTLAAAVVLFGWR
jgi:glucose/arabinose dehydrogenase